ncbi:MAG: purine-nucleoside phosphorylase [Cetobacterium sp.]|uniref:Purine nucleoside phosphorylase n=1 Tax=Cetobacterium ceti TaxID=180163 RepID=A0A1T4N170_9FUSO|nr:purine-nucleoside phosphorylase [Cetobacterium ceti]MCJ8342369.1 purine-nucleoside phosphorylase [Cetobacterium sp.]SJZ72745.1 purine-nucleoside phosphorylase [Cetobacterium ceti]
MYNKVQETVEFLKNKVENRPKIAIILGSGLGDLVDFVENKKIIPYEEIPNFPVSTVKGHAGQLVFGQINGVEVLVMKGRFHYYEGYDMKVVTYPQYVFKAFGIEKMVVSNAAGGINKEFNPGTLMLITDHINSFGTNPLIGKNDEKFGPRFPDLSEAYNKGLIESAKKVANKLGIEYKEGVYAGVTGPSYETGAEIKMFSLVGASAVGMSTVPEVIVANYLGIKVLGISCITNMATGIATKPHSHEEVVHIAKVAGAQFCNWVAETISEIA